MAFNSLSYAVLFLATFGIFWLLSPYRRWRNLFLLAVSYLFYASWNPRYLTLIFFSSSLDYFVGRHMDRSGSPRVRRALLSFSIAMNMGILATFKYFNFFAEEFARLAAVFGFTPSPIVLDVLLPVGISFYTFQTMSYIIDLYRRRLPVAQNYAEYLLFVSFFPQLVAGPIVRASHLLPQFGRTPSLTVANSGRALFLIGIGLVKKMAVADYLGAHLVDPVFSAPWMYSSPEALVAVWAYAFQIYADFSAYSDIAIGSAALLGFDIPLNFRAPYTAQNLRDFWQRWHISLSSWLRDYLYIPLGGSRKGHARTYINLLITMLLGGLWHGAALNFIVWGAIHGLALVLTRVWQRALPTPKPNTRLRRFGQTLLTFHVVCAAWIFFRAASFADAAAVFRAIASTNFGVGNLMKPASLILLAAMLTHGLVPKHFDQLRKGFTALPAVVQAVLLVSAVAAAHYLAQTEVAPFIYFQF